MGAQAEGAGLFVVFFLSLYTIVLVPYTIYKLCNLSQDKHVVKPWAKGSKRKPWLSGASRQLTKTSNLVLIGLWLFFFFLVFYVQVAIKDSAPFDPYNILELEKGATDKEVKRAYRQLSLKFHPDKNPDPEANKYFAEYITKAYQALSDPAARENYEKYGHPDGQQAISMGIALPKWLLEGDAKLQPLLLAGLVLVFILLPLVAAACYLFSADKYVGKDGIVAETYEIFLRTPYAIKEGQGLPRIMETLTVAVEFINLPTLANQLPALEELRKETLRAHSDLRDKKPFWQRKPGCVKAGMLLLAHMERMPTHATLAKDRRFVLNRSAALLAEMVNLAALPRPPLGYGWLAPMVGSIEFLQHLIQAVPLAARRNPGAHKGTVEGTAPLLQLPHLDAEVARKLMRKKVRGLPELHALPAAERRDVLTFAGLTDDQVEEVDTALSSMPTVTVVASCEVDGEPEAQVQVEDVVTCKARVLLSRPSHATHDLGKEGAAVAAFVPQWPEPREEKWFFFVADPQTNEVCSPVEHISLVEAEFLSADATQAAKQAANGGSSTSAGNGAQAQQNKSKATAADNEPVASSDGDTVGQLVEVKFMPRTAARKDYMLFVMCDSWIGADRVVPLKLKVAEKSRAEREGRAGRASRVIPLDEYGNPEEEVDDFYAEDEEGDEEGEEDDDEEYDSEDSGTEESGSDDEQEAADAAAGKAAKVEDADEDDSDQSTAEHQNGIVPKAATLQEQGS